MIDKYKEEQNLRYYLVAIPEGEIADKGKALQKEFSTLYQIYREPYPPLHITVGVLSFPLEKLARIQSKIAEVIKPSLPLRLLTLGESCFPDPYKSINLSIERSKELVELSARVIDFVTGIGFTAEPFDGWDYHISLVNRNYAAREWTEAEFEDACRRLRKERLILNGTARRLELWDPEYPPLKVLASFTAASNLQGKHKQNPV